MAAKVLLFYDVHKYLWSKMLSIFDFLLSKCVIYYCYMKEKL
jgi:hypothetical protein